MVVTVDQLLLKPFINRFRNERIEIVREGKPRPSLPLLKFENLDCDSEVVFNTATYDHVEWLTGCDIRQALFCWTCLLFRIGADEWNKTGITDLNNLHGKIDYHAKSISHLQSTLDLKLFHSQVVNNGVAEPPKLPAEVIRKNREIAQRIIDAVCALSAEQHLSEDGKISYLTADDCIKNMQLIRQYDIVKTGVIDDAIEMLKTFPQILNDVVKAVANVVKVSIQGDVADSTYVSLILSEHSQEPMKSNISVVLRYLKGSEVCERFVEFARVVGDKTCNMICKHMNKVIEEYDMSQKLLAFSMDGAVFPDLEIFNQYVDYVRDKEDQLHFFHPYTCFIPCHFHKLDYVLQQSLSVYHECDVFFKNIKTLTSYFKKGSKVSTEFQNHVASSRNIDELDIDSFDSADCLKVLVIIKLHTKDCISFLERILLTGEHMIEGDLVKIHGLIAYLKEFGTYFLLETLVKFFLLISPLTEALYGDNPEKAFNTELIDEVHKSLLHALVESFEERNNSPKSFQTYFEKLVRSFESTEQPVSANASDDIISSYYELYRNILRCFCNQIKYRFIRDEKPVLSNVSDLKREGQFLNRNFVKNVTVAYEMCFDYASLEKEMESLENNQAILDCESVYQLRNVFLKFSLKHSCPYLHKLIELVLTLPSTLPIVKNIPSKLTDLNAYSDSTPDGNENVSDLTLLCIERDYLIELKKRYSFHEQVMVRLHESNQILPLM